MYQIFQQSKKNINDVNNLRVYNKRNFIPDRFSGMMGWWGGLELGLVGVWVGWGGVVVGWRWSEGRFGCSTT